MYVLQIWHGQKIWCPVFNFRFENIERFRGLYVLRDQFCSQVYYGFSTEENCTEFLLGVWTPLLSS